MSFITVILVILLINVIILVCYSSNVKNNVYKSSDYNNNNNRYNYNNNNNKKYNNKKKKQQRLQDLIQQLEENNYGSFGSWGNFKYLPVKKEDNYNINISNNSKENNITNHMLTSIYSNIYNNIDSQQNQIDGYNYQNSLNRLTNTNEKLLLKNSKELVANFINIYTLIKVTVLVLYITTLCYLSADGISSSINNRNEIFINNIKVIPIYVIWPVLLLKFMYKSTYVDINKYINTFVNGALFIYPIIWSVECLVATVTKLGLLKIFESEVFEIYPDISYLFLPWKLIKANYRPQIITLLLDNAIINCMFVPIIEQLTKLVIVNNVIQSLLCNHIHSYISYMLSLSIGIKLMDNVRRMIQCNDKPVNTQLILAIARSVYPIIEISGCLLAFSMYKYKKLSNQSTNILTNISNTMKIFQPSILLHSLAIFKGMKPIYQMISKQPWYEVQLYISLQSLTMLLKSSITTIWWMIVLSRYIVDIMRLYNIYHNDYIDTLNRRNSTLDIF